MLDKLRKIVKRTEKEVSFPEKDNLTHRNINQKKIS